MILYFFFLWIKNKHVQSEDAYTFTFLCWKKNLTGPLGNAGLVKKQNWQKGKIE